MATVIIVVLMVGLAVVVFFASSAFVANRKAQLTQRTFRVVASMSDELAGRIRAIKTTFEAFGNCPEHLGLTCPPGTSAAERPGATRRAVDAVMVGGDKPVVLFQFQPDEATLPVRPIIDELSADESLEDIWIVDWSTHGVVYQHNRARVGYVSDVLPLVKAAAPKTPPTEPCCEAKQRPASEEKLTLGLGTGSPQEIKWRGDAHLLFCQPIPAADVSKGARKGVMFEHLTLCGVLNEASLAHEARDIPYGWIIVLILASVLAALSWPVLKLWLMGANERLSGVDVRLVVLSVLLVTGIMTIMLRSVRDQTRDTAKGKQDLLWVAGWIEQAFTNEHKLAKQQLELALETLREGARPETISLLPASGGNVSDLVILEPNGSSEYHWGPQRVSDGWVLHKDTPPLVGAADRTYFAQAQAKRGLSDPEVIISKVTGRYSLALATAVPASKDGPIPVLLLVTRLLPLVHAALPYGLSFAIIDQDGDVKLHSVTQRSLRENLFTETDRSRMLRTAVWSQRPAYVDVTYGGRGAKALVRPLDGTPWFLVVLRDESLWQAMNAEILLSSTLALLGYLGLLVLVLFVVQIVGDRYRADWLWPNRAETTFDWRYWASSGALLAIAYLLTVAAEGQKWETEAKLIAAVPATVLAILCLGFGRRDAVGERRVARGVLVGGTAVLLWAHASSTNPEGITALLVALAALGLCVSPVLPSIPVRRKEEFWFRLPYMLLLTTLAGILIVAPALVLYADAQSQTEQSASQLAKKEHGAALARREERLVASKFPDLSRSELIERSRDQPQVPAATALDGDGSREAQRRALQLASFTHERLPHYSDLAVRLRSVTGTLWWLPDPSDGVWWVLAIAGGLLLLALVWSLAERVFVLHADSMRTSDVALPLKKPMLSHWAFTRRAETPSSEDELRISLKYASSPEKLRTEMQLFPGNAPVRLLHLESVLDSQKWRRELPALLDELFKDRTLILDGLVEPQSFVRDVLEERATQGGPLKPEEAARLRAEVDQAVTFWTNLLADFEKQRIDVDFREPITAADGATGDRLDDRLDGTYRELWTTSTRAEKLALRQLAEEGFLNPNNAEVARNLMRRRLVRRSPAFVFLHDKLDRSFARFVLRAESPKTIADWQRSAAPSTWERLRFPLGAAILIVAGFLAITQRDVLNSTVTAVTALTGALPIVIQLFGALGQRQAERR